MTETEKANKGVIQLQSHKWEIDPIFWGWGIKREDGLFDPRSQVNTKLRAETEADILTAFSILPAHNLFLYSDV